MVRQPGPTVAAKSESHKIMTCANTLIIAFARDGSAWHKEVSYVIVPGNVGA